jgi:outer membrane biosynthesis protein TonB
VFLRVLFRPTYSKLRQQACLWISGGSVVKMEIELEAVALLAPDGSRLAQGDNSPGNDLDAPVTKPQILVRRPRTASGGDVPDALARASTELGPLLLPCYRKALEMRPSLRGTLVLGIKVGPDGSVEESHMELSSLGDEALAACAAAKAGKAKLTAGPGRMSVTVVFGSRDDR